MDNGASSYRRFLSGEKEAFTEIVRDYRDGLVLYLNCFFDSICTAEEIAEDTLLKLYVDKPRFSGRCTFKTWLHTIGRNTAVDFIRKRSRRPEVPLDDFYSLADKTDIENSYIKGEDKRALYRAIEKINEDYRQVLYLVYFEDFTNTETAKIMGKNERQIRNLLYRAKGALRAALEKEGFEYEKL